MQTVTSSAMADLPFVTVKADLLASLPKLRSYAMSLCRAHDRADDLVQETVTRAIANIHSFEPGSNIMGWLFTILRNQFYSEVRKRRHEIEDLEGSYADNPGTPATQDGHIHFLELQDALGRLAPDHREALMLIGVSGLSYDAAAAHCGCAVGTMKSRVSRARVKLAESLGIHTPFGGALSIASLHAS
jgi:RNA polymerase sigma-70 factor, ECF subfamily